MLLIRVTFLVLILGTVVSFLRYRPTNNNWKKLDGLLSRISMGQKGIYGINSGGNLYRRDGNRWTYTVGGWRDIAVGKEYVWGTKQDYSVWRSSDSDGSNWEKLPGGLSTISTSDKDHTWAINSGHNIYRWVEAACNWQHISGGLSKITVGEAGVWGSKFPYVHYRRGTYGDTDTAGTGWQHVPGGRLVELSSGKNLLVGVDDKGLIVYRSGISAGNPTGNSWVTVNTKMAYVEVYKHLIIGRRSDYTIYISHLEAY